MSKETIRVNDLTESLMLNLIEETSIQLPEDITTLRIPVKGSVPCFVVYNVPNGSLKGRAVGVTVNDNLVLTIDYNDDGGVKQNLVNLGGFLREGVNDLRLVTVVFGINFHTTCSFTVLSEGSTIISNFYQKPEGFGGDVIDQHWQLEFTP